MMPYGVTGGNERLDSQIEPIAGFIFMCSGRTKPECFQYRVFGLPSRKLEDVRKIQPGMKLFLFDFDVKLLYGIYEATSYGQLNLEPMAFSQRFPSQVKFRIFKDCLPVPESVFKYVIQDNYFCSSKFNQALRSTQVNSLMELFRPIDLSQPPASNTLHHHTNVLHMPSHHQLEQANTQLPYQLYVPESRALGVQSVTDPRYYSIEAPNVHSNPNLQRSDPSNVPEEPGQSVTGTYGRVAASPEMASLQLPVGYLNGHYTSDPPSGIQAAEHLKHRVDYHSQQAAPASVYRGSAPATMLPYGSVPSYYIQPPSYYAHAGPLSSSYQSYQPYNFRTTHMAHAQAYGAVPSATTVVGSGNSSNESGALAYSEYVYTGVAPTQH